MASLPFAARSASSPSASTVSRSMRARDSLSSTIRRRFMMKAEVMNAEGRRQKAEIETASAFCILHSAFDFSQAKPIPNPREHRPLYLLGRDGAECVEVLLAAGDLLR